MYDMVYTKAPVAYTSSMTRDASSAWMPASHTRYSWVGWPSMWPQSRLGLLLQVQVVGSANHEAAAAKGAALGTVSVTVQPPQLCFRQAIQLQSLFLAAQGGQDVACPRRLDLHPTRTTREVYTSPHGAETAILILDFNSVRSVVEDLGDEPDKTAEVFFRGSRVLYSYQEAIEECLSESSKQGVNKIFNMMASVLNVT
ncbi:hypothetical protein PR202_ga28459 [Eleusine coracana subsp. coracana]|uniref:Uncharacterized protein n=1 Tax=Eleusine coracana subsp. coracana TaxID=191504 RepID=A0AAV5DJN6_ELECO|nr:hypothetical protein PR202_ga28459 [Eleusine coracana subsp. coracana]